MDFPVLDDNNFLLYTAKHYNNPQCSGIDEFKEDLNRIKYLKRLLRRYRTSGELRDRLILNHIIILYNVFGIIPASRILFGRIEEEFHPALKTFLVFLNCLPTEEIPEADLPSIFLEENIVKILRSI